VHILLLNNLLQENGSEVLQKIFNLQNELLGVLFRIVES